MTIRSGRRIVFIGGREHGHALVERLFAADHDVARIYALREDDHEPVRFDRRIDALARAAGVPCALRRRLTKADMDAITSDPPDLIIVLGWRTLLPPAVIHAPRLGCVGVHDSLLPKYRGFAPTNWAIINRERTTGVTLWYLNEEVDAGEIIAQQEIPIGPGDTGADVYARVAHAAVELLMTHLEAILAGTAPRRAQDEALATYACARTPADGEIDWTRPSSDVAALVRALARPYPGALTYLGGDRMRVWNARDLPEPPTYAGRIAGRVVKLVPGEGVDVLCGSGV